MFYALQTYKNGSDLPKEPQCVTDSEFPVTLLQKAGYKYNETFINYKFTLSIYHKCGTRANIKNIDFDEAIEGLDGNLP